MTIYNTGYDFGEPINSSFQKKISKKIKKRLGSPPSGAKQVKCTISYFNFDTHILYIF